MHGPIGPWPAAEAPDETWNCVTDEPPATSELVDCIWVVCSVRHNSMRFSFGKAAMLGDRHWINEQGSQIVFNPQFWKALA